MYNQSNKQWRLQVCTIAYWSGYRYGSYRVVGKNMTGEQTKQILTSLSKPLGLAGLGEIFSQTEIPVHSTF